MNKYRPPLRGILLSLAFGLSLAACSTVKYQALEKVGIYKRDILVDRVEDARDSQEQTKRELVEAYAEPDTLRCL